MRSGSAASSVLVGGANTVGPSFGAPTSASLAAFSVNGNNNVIHGTKLSVNSALNNPITIPRPSCPLKRLRTRLLSTLYVSSGGCQGSGEERVGDGRMDEYSIVTIEEATADGHGRECDDEEVGCSLMKRSIMG